MPNQLVIFDYVQVLGREGMGYLCRVAERVVWVSDLQWQAGSTIQLIGNRLVLCRADAAELGLISWKPK